MTTTADFWSKGITTDNVLGGPARILVSLRSVTTYPLLISDVLSLATYDPAANWYDLGHTSEPFNIAEGFDTTNWVSQQIGKFNLQVGDWNRTIGVTLMETDNDWVMDLAHETSERTVNSEGDQVTYFGDHSDVTEWRVAALHLAEAEPDGANIIMDVFPNCKRSGSDSTTAWDRGNPQTATVELVPFPDEMVPNSANWYRVRQL